MTRHSNQTTPSKLNILKQLEYCRLDRAAELLSCEVSDLIHFGVTERVTVYLLLATEHAASVHFTKITDAFSNSLGTYKSGTFTFDLNTSMRHFRLDELEDSSLSLRALLYGLWQLPPYIIGDIESDILPDLDNLNVRISAETAQGEIAYADLSEWDFRPTVKDLYLKQADLQSLYDHLAKGTLLERKTKSSCEQEAQARPTAETKHRTTIKQCEAIVDALKMAGLTDADFKGTIEALKDKLADLGSDKLVYVDKNTLIDWLNRAGVR